MAATTNTFSRVELAASLEHSLARRTTGAGAVHGRSPTMPYLTRSQKGRPVTSTVEAFRSRELEWPRGRTSAVPLATRPTELSPAARIVGIPKPAISSRDDPRDKRNLQTRSHFP